MPHLNIVTKEDATGEVEKIYKETEDAYGMIPNLYKGFANSPAALKAYIAISDALEEADLKPREREVVRLTASQHNGCHYCLAAHTAIGKKTGLDDETIKDIRRGKSDNKRFQALITFTRSLLDKKGNVDQETVQRFKDNGFDDGHVAEVLALIAQKTFSNWFNHVNDTDVDFPEAPAL